MSQISAPISLTVDVEQLQNGVAGSVLFVGSGGIISQDNGNFFWNDSSNILQVSAITVAGSLSAGATSVSSLSVSGTSVFTDAATFGNITVNNNATINGALRLNDGVTLSSSFTSGSVLFVGSNKEIAQDNSGLFFDSTNNRLGIGTITPDVGLHVVSTASYRGFGSAAIAITGGNASLVWETSEGSGTGLAIANVAGAMQFFTNFTGSAYAQRGEFSATNGGLLLTPGALTSGAPIDFRFTQPAHTGLTASTEVISVNYNLSSTVQHATGALTTQRGFVIQAPTYGFVGASTITNAATFAVTNAPTAGTNATITNAYALWVQAGKTQLDGNVVIAPAATATGSVSVFVLTGAANTNQTASAEAIDVNFNLSRTVEFATGALATQRAFAIQAPTYGFVGASTVTVVSTFFTSAPAAGSNATFTNTAAIRAGADVNVGPTSASMQYAMFDAFAHTVTVTGTTQVTSAASFAMAHLHTLTITDSSAVTIDRASTLYIAAAPVAAGSVTITDAYAIFVDAGSSRFDGRVLKAFAAVASATNLTLTGANGFELTGTTKVDLISNVGWTEGSVVTLVANESVVIDHGTATSGTNVQIRLAGAVDYSMTAGDTLTLMLSSTTAEGQAWREIGRAVI